MGDTWVTPSCDADHGPAPICCSGAVCCIGIRCNPILSRDGQGTNVAIHIRSWDDSYAHK
jgi:hypothetical protein